MTQMKDRAAYIDLATRIGFKSRPFSIQLDYGPGFRHNKDILETTVYTLGLGISTPRIYSFADMVKDGSLQLFDSAMNPLSGTWGDSLKQITLTTTGDNIRLENTLHIVQGGGDEWLVRDSLNHLLQLAKFLKCQQLKIQDLIPSGDYPTDLILTPDSGDDWMPVCRFRNRIQHTEMYLDKPQQRLNLRSQPFILGISYS